MGNHTGKMGCGREKRGEEGNVWIGRGRDLAALLRNFNQFQGQNLNVIGKHMGKVGFCREKI